MFRAMRRSARALSRQGCIALLVNEPRGVPAVHGEDGYPYAFPIHQLYPDGKLYFHCADARVSFCIIGRGFRRAGVWPLSIQSVIGFGRIRKIKSERALPVIRALGIRHYLTPESVEAQIHTHFCHGQILEFPIDPMSGKPVHAS